MSKNTPKITTTAGFDGRKLRTQIAMPDMPQPQRTLAEIEAMIADLADDDELPADLKADARAHFAIVAQQLIDQHPGMTVGEIRDLQRLADPDAGFVPTNGALRVSYQAIGRLHEWETRPGGIFPETDLRRYGVQGTMGITGENAMRVWHSVRDRAKGTDHGLRQAGDILPDVFIAVMCLIHERPQQLDLFGPGRPYVQLQRLMPMLGLVKHDRKYNITDLEKVRDAVRAIADISVRGVQTKWLAGASSPVMIPFEDTIWTISGTVPDGISSEAELQAFLRRHGDLSDPADRWPITKVAGWKLSVIDAMMPDPNERPQMARTMRAIMAYPPVHGRFKRRLGYSLSCEFRLRYREQNWDQPYTVRNVIDDAALSVDAHNPKRTYRLFHEALRDLQDDRVIGDVRYVKPPRRSRPFDPGYDTGTRGWTDVWLDAQIVIMPAPDIEAAYRASLASSVPAAIPAGTKKQRKRSR